MKISFNGYYGYSNTGDDAFIEVAAWGAEKYWKCTNTKFLSQSLPKIKTKADYTGRAKFRGHAFIKAMKLIYESDGFINAGGSIFHSLTTYRDPNRISLLKKKHLKRKYVCGSIGVSLGPFVSSKAEKMNVELLKNFDFLVLRDSLSYEMAKSYDLPYQPVQGFDLAALLPIIYSQEEGDSLTTPGRRILGISLCNYERYISNGDIKNENRRNFIIENLLLKLAMIDDSILLRFFIFNGNLSVGDENLTLSVANKIREVSNCKIEILAYNPNVFCNWQSIKECDVMLATRLHASIFACFSEIPFFLVEYHRKCTDFLETIGYSTEMRIFDAKFDIDSMANRLIALIDKDMIFEAPKNLKVAMDLSLRNFTSNDEYFLNKEY